MKRDMINISLCEKKLQWLASYFYYVYKLTASFVLIIRIQVCKFNHINCEDSFISIKKHSS